MAMTNIRLTQLYPECVPGIAAAIDDDYVQKYTIWLREPHRPPIEEAIGWFSHSIYLNRTRQKFTRVVIDESSNYCIGAFGSGLWRPDIRVAGQRWELGYVIHKDFRNQGIGTKALSMYLDEFRVFATNIGTVTLTAEICETNLASRKLVERQGFSLYEKPPYETWEKLLRDGSTFRDRQLLYWKSI